MVNLTLAEFMAHEAKHAAKRRKSIPSAQMQSVEAEWPDVMGVGKGYCTRHKSKSYNENVVKSFFASQGIPAPEFEYQFHPIRKWRFDMAWKHCHTPIKIGSFNSLKQTWVKVAVEVDGGIWIAGGHNRGAQMKKDWEKSNSAVTLGWRILRCEPKDLCTVAFAEIIKSALGVA